ncbi:MAG: type I DNA topoisomerase [Bacilli bacterium]|nr:type I DNA topoisomerase [Bacilli bacterium]
MKLVIVESPAKSKTITHYLGDKYIVEASVGHVRDLAMTGKGRLGVDVEHDFKPTYSINDDKKEVIKKLKKLAKESEEVILATDPDREGEAIAFHLAEVLGLPIETTKRLEFHEITKDSITNAIANPRTIDMKLVHSQETRRIIDRIIGFKISTLINNRMNSKSAGRVQSVTLKLICDHEKEINEFVPQEYWEINSIIKVDKEEIKLDFFGKDKKIEIKNKEQADEILSKLCDKFVVNDIKSATRKVASKEPFRTSTLQQDAFTKYNFKAKDTMSIAQKLYEGVELDDGLTGLITYMRTDSVVLSKSFEDQAVEFIKKNFGEQYLKGDKTKTKKVNLSQDAHEAIRPTSVLRTPEKMKKFLTDREYKLYKLIYNRAIGSLMSDKVIESTDISFDNNGYIFKYKLSEVKFNGYDILKLDDAENTVKYDFKVGESFDKIEINSEQLFTKAPARYSEGKLVKLMEDSGIGRPSTYASTIQTLLARKYITSEKGILAPTEQGTRTAYVLEKYFPDLMNTDYTALMETNLDKISDGSVDELDVLKEFYGPFETHFEEVKGTMYKDKPEYTGETCPECGSPLVLKHGRHGDFVSCSNYPKCKYVKKEEKDKPEEVGRECPNCGSPLVYRFNKKGQKFIGCSNFPKCKHIESLEIQEQEVKICPKCGSTLVVKGKRGKYFYGCTNYPNCDYTESLKSKK